jgi:hypothetical protein
MKKINENRSENKKSFVSIFNKFCKSVKHGDAKILTDMLYAKYIVEDFYYIDDSIWYSVKDYLENVVVPHKIAVYNSGIELLKKLEETPNNLNFNKKEFELNLVTHDLSKFSFIEAYGYTGWSFKTNSGNKEAFDLAWHHHKHNNMHHPEYWFSVDRSGNPKVIKIPTVYLLEMVADWMGAGKTYGTPMEEWLPKNLHYFKFHNDTCDELKSILKVLGIECYIGYNSLHVD